MASDVGYRRPPASGQFKKGSSGNPKGRPKGSNNFQTLLEKELAQKIVVNENGKKKPLTRMQAVIKRLVSGALQGDQKQLLALVEIMRRASSLAPTHPEELLPTITRRCWTHTSSRDNRGRGQTENIPRTENANEAAYQTGGLSRRSAQRL